MEISLFLWSSLLPFCEAFEKVGAGNMQDVGVPCIYMLA